MLETVLEAQDNVETKQAAIFSELAFMFKLENIGGNIWRELIS